MPVDAARGRTSPALDTSSILKGRTPMAWKSIAHHDPQVVWATDWEDLEEIQDFYTDEWLCQELTALFAAVARQTRMAAA